MHHLMSIWDWKLSRHELNLRACVLSTLNLNSITLQCRSHVRSSLLNVQSHRSSRLSFQSVNLNLCLKILSIIVLLVYDIKFFRLDYSQRLFTWSFSSGSFISAYSLMISCLSLLFWIVLIKSGFILVAFCTDRLHDNRWKVVKYVVLVFA
jgi:hypothetical protein